MGDPKIDKAPNKLTIASGINKWCTVSWSEVNTKLHRTWVLCLTKTLLHKGNVLRFVTCDDHVIDIEKKCATMRSVNKESRIVVTRFEASIDDNRGETLEPSTRSLLKAIEGTTQPTNHPIQNGVPWRWLHIHFLTVLAIEEGVLDIQLRNQPLTNRSNCKKSPYSSHVSDRSKGLLSIVMALLLLETARHKTSLVVLKRAIRAGLYLVHPLASDTSDMRWQMNKILGASTVTP